MDHLPRVKDPVHGHGCAVVPLLPDGLVYGSEARGHEGFESFLKTTATAPEECPALLQSWLYFGLLAEAFGYPDFHYDYHDFLESNGAGSVRVTTRHLIRYAWYWVAMVQHESRDVVEAHTQNLDNCLRTTNTVMNNVVARYEYQESSTTSWSPVTMVHLSIVVLAEFLCEARRRIVKDGAGVTLQWDFPFLDNVLVDVGWCPAEIPSLRRECNVACRYYLSTIDRRVLGKNHRRCTANGNAYGCCALQIEFSTYETKHRPGCQAGSRCRFIGVPSAQLAESLRSDYTFPVVSFASSKTGEDGHIQLHTMDKRDAGSYVAISHVWSDGLGNPQSNALPLCQLKHIQSRVNALYGPDSHGAVKFWIDTLCIPVGRQHIHFRHLAISRIVDIFRRAVKVLVLDNSLQHYTSDVSWEEIGVRIMYSAWKTRVWTFLEGRVNRSLWFQFNGGAVLADNYVQVPGMIQGLPAVSEMLKEQGFDRVRENVSSMRLARALAMYDLDSMTQYLRGTYTYTQEERDQYQAENPHQAEIHGTWKPFIVDAGLEHELSDVDENVRNELGVICFCPIVQKSTKALQDVSGSQYPLYVEEQRELDPDSEPHVPYELFIDICIGFQGRKTSRREDESICLALLSGIDTMELEAIRPLDWRLKEWLAWVGESAPAALTSALSWLGISIQRCLDDCHERRMKVLLTRISRFQEDIILWNASRLRGLGWKWAPFSFLGLEVDMGGRQYGRWATIRDEGLEVRLRAIRLSWTQAQKGDDDPRALETPIEEEVSVIIHYDESRMFPRLWQHIRVRLERRADVNSWDGVKTWSDVLRSGLVNRFIILYSIKFNSSLAGTGALVEKYGMSESDSVHLTYHRALVKRMATAEDLEKSALPAIHVAGTADSESVWCVG